MQTALERDGFALASAVVTPDQIATVTSAFETVDIARAKRGGITFGARNLLDLPEVRAVAASPGLNVLLTQLLGPDYCVVRGLFFDKTEAANWPVLWHQDLSLAIKEQRDLPGWNNWSLKRDVLHVQPPAAILACMLTVRLHLDDCDEDNGPLRVISGSHCEGIFMRDAIRLAAQTGRDHVVLAKAGDALFMRPLILHASSPAKRPRHRRVLHLEFAPAGLLPSGLEWASACYFAGGGDEGKIASCAAGGT